MSKTVVVGGGLSGLCVARILSNEGNDVALIERESHLGGLLQSKTNILGHVFDKGTHFISGTTIPELNELLFADMDFESCYRFDESMRVGSYFNGTLNNDSDCINTRSLPSDIYQKGLVEMLNCSPTVERARNMEEFCLQNFGSTFTENIFAPVAWKYANTPLNKLDQDATNAFAITRLVVLDRFATSQLKASEFYEKRIAWAHRDDGSSSAPKWYSKNQGVGMWVNSLENRIRADGVRLFTDRKIKNIELYGQEVRRLELDNEEKIDCDTLIWTIPPVFFLDAVGVSTESSRPKFRNVYLFDYSIDTELETDLHCVVNFDSTLVNNRVTLYPNITKDQRVPSPHHLTVEVITDLKDEKELSSKVFAELKEMGIISRVSKILWQDQTIISPGWPIITTEFRKDAQKILEAAQKVATNTKFVGRGKSHNSHFMNEILEDIYRVLCN